MADTRLNWAPIVARAAEIVRSYEIQVTLRQLFYRLVMEELIPNDQTAYKTLSSQTAGLRRKNEFPALFDRGRRILQPAAWNGPAAAMRALINQYRVDRTEGQDYMVFLGVEKNALAGLLQEWFDEYGVPVLPLGGYSSEGIDRVVKQQVARDGRPAILIYAGDFDASGMDIGRNFIAQTDCWEETIRVGLSEELIVDLGLPVLKGKPADSRAPKFIDAHPEIHARHDFGMEWIGQGKARRLARVPVQVELDAVDPARLHNLFMDALNEYWDHDSYQDTLDREDEDTSTLRWLAERLEVA